MKLSYFPGCTLKNKAKKLDIYARRSAELLGVELEEIKNWQCCGGVFTNTRDDIATKLASVRALAAAEATCGKLVSVCSACHNVLKQTDNAMKNDGEFRDKVNRYMNGEGLYNGKTEVCHYLEMLRDTVGFDELAKRVVFPLKNMKIAAYYGCLLLRPSSVMNMDDPENPRIMEDLIRALGADPIIYSNRNECCGGYVFAEDRALAKKQSLSVLENAKARGAEIVMTACPLCKYNLEKCGNGLKVVYFTELLAKALGLTEEENG